MLPSLCDDEDEHEDDNNPLCERILGALAHRVRSTNSDATTLKFWHCSVCIPTAVTSGGAKHPFPLFFTCALCDVTSPP